jgi:hypothetical protein
LVVPLFVVVVFFRVRLQVESEVEELCVDCSQDQPGRY